MYDKIEKLLNSTIQHGKENDRIYLMKLDDKDYPQIINELERISKENGYSKIFVKVKESKIDEFIKFNYKIEAKIPKFYYGEEDGIFLGKYLDKSRERLTTEDADDIKLNIQTANSKAGSKKASLLPEGFRMIDLNSDYSNALADLYKIVFPSYPFPIHDPKFIAETMSENVKYFGIIEETSVWIYHNVAISHVIIIFRCGIALLVS